MPGFKTWFTDKTYTPDIPFEPDEGDRRGAKDALGKRPSFNPAVRAELERRTERKKAQDPDGKPYLSYTCSSCGRPGAGADMHIGHKENWEDYVASKGPLCAGAVVAAYNDLKNLRFEHLVCNVSHLFESKGGVSMDDFREKGWSGLDARSREALANKLMAADWITGKTKKEVMAKAKSASEIFALLAKRHEPPTETAVSTLEVFGKTNLVLAEPTTKHRKDTRLKIKEMDRPAWDKSTRNGLFSMWKAMGFVTVKDDVTYYRCASCGNYGEGHAMHIGHIENWKTYLQKTVGEADGTCRQDHAQWAYNDLQNLQFEHTTCNMGHEWEEMAVGALPVEIANDIRALNKTAPRDIKKEIARARNETEVAMLSNMMLRQVYDTSREMASRGRFEDAQVWFGSEGCVVSAAELETAAKLLSGEITVTGEMTFGTVRFGPDMLRAISKEALEEDVPVLSDSDERWEKILREDEEMSSEGEDMVVEEAEELPDEDEYEDMEGLKAEILGRWNGTAAAFVTNHLMRSLPPVSDGPSKKIKLEKSD